MSATNFPVLCLTLLLSLFVRQAVPQKNVSSSGRTISDSDRLPILIGQSTSMNGIGGGLRAGMAFAFDEANAAGGISSRNVTLISLEDGGNTTVAMKNINQLLDVNNVLVIAGVTGSAILPFVKPLLAQRHVAYVGPMSGVPLTRTPFQEEIVNVRASYWDEMIAHSAFLVQYMLMQRIACVYQNDVFGIAGYSAAEAALHRAGMDFMSTSTTTGTATDLGPTVDDLLDGPQKPQAVIVIASSSTTIRFVQQYRSDPRADPDCIFTIMSVALNSTFTTQLGAENWPYVFFFQVVPVPGDPNWKIAQRFDSAYRAAGLIPDTFIFEGYVTGRFILEVLRGIGRIRNLTRDMFLDEVYKTRLFGLDDLLVGLYGRDFDGCSPAICACNSGLRNIFFSLPDPKTGALLPGLPSLRYSITECSSPVSNILKPVLFGQLIPTGDAAWEAIARQIGQGILAAFNETNAAGGIGGRLFRLIQQEYTKKNSVVLKRYNYTPLSLLGLANSTKYIFLKPDDATITSMADRFSLVAMLGSVVDTTSTLEFPMPTIGNFDMHWTAEVSSFNVTDMRIQPSLALEVMALVEFATTEFCNTIHFRAPGTAEGQDMLDLLLKSIHNWQRQPDTSKVFGTAAEALQGVTSGCVVALGTELDISAMYISLGDIPNVHLLTTSPNALHALATPSYGTLPQASRLHFPTLNTGVFNATDQPAAMSEAFQYGYLVAQAALQALMRSKYSTESYTTAQQMVDAWYTVKVMSYGALTLGAYSNAKCVYAQQTDCECNEGARTVGIRSGVSPNTEHLYTSLACSISYRPLVDNTAMIGGIAGSIASVCLILLITWFFVFINRRNNSTAPKNPSKPFCIVFTDIQASTHLWATIPKEMATALNTHHNLIRQLILKHKAYEVKTIGDSFMCALRTPTQAMQFALALQKTFFEYDWGTDAIDEVYEDQLPGPYHHECWNGLRVRVSIHYGLGDIKFDPVSRGYDYYGTVVNTAARIESASHGGQIVVSQAVFDYLNGEFPATQWWDLGFHILRGFSEPLRLYQVLPTGILSSRQFPPLRTGREEAQDLIEDDVSIASSSDLENNLTKTKRNQIIPTDPSHTSTGSAPHENWRWTEVHPLVLKGDITAEELKRHYLVLVAGLSTLFATQTPKFKEFVVNGLCSRLKVRNFGVDGVPLQQTLRGLVHRILPAAITSHAPVLSRKSSKSTMASLSRNMDQMDV